MKYLTPELFESRDLKTPVQAIKRYVEQTDPLICDSAWKATYGWYKCPPCSGKVSLKVIRRYYRIMDWNSALPQTSFKKARSLHIYPLCEEHGKRHRNLTPKEEFYIRVLSENNS